MIEGRVRHALDLLDQTHEANGYAGTDPILLDEIATFLASFPEGEYADFWQWHLERVSTRIERDRGYALANARP
jgi:hypothetical protein